MANREASCDESPVRIDRYTARKSVLCRNCHSTDHTPGQPRLLEARPRQNGDTDVVSIPALLKHVDFFCIGTNDLTQYTLAAARDDASVNDYFLDSHESVVRLLSIVMTDAADRPVTLCGKLAGREAQVPRLLKMGFRALSVAPSLIPTAKALIPKLSISEGYDKAI